MSICDTCRHQTPHRNCRLAIERGAGVFWGDKLRKCQYREDKAGRDDKQCSLCGRAGHSANACPWGREAVQ